MTPSGVLKYNQEGLSMDKTYSIEDLAGFTGLTDRTLRSYLQ